MLAARHKKWLYAGLALLVVGIVLLVLPPYTSYCDSAGNDHQYRCVPYEIATVAHVFSEAHNAFITAIATGIIALFTFTIWRINRSQLVHSHDVERAYISGGGAPINKRIPIPWPATYDATTTARLETVEVPTGRFRLDINNHGKTKGEVVEYGYGWCEVGEVSKLPERPPYRWVEFCDQIGLGTQSRWIKTPNSPIINRLYSDVSVIAIFLGGIILMVLFRMLVLQSRPLILPILNPIPNGICPMSASEITKKKNPRVNPTISAAVSWAAWRLSVVRRARGSFLWPLIEHARPLSDR